MSETITRDHSHVATVLSNSLGEVRESYLRALLAGKGIVESGLAYYSALGACGLALTEEGGDALVASEEQRLCALLTPAGLEAMRAADGPDSAGPDSSSEAPREVRVNGLDAIALDVAQQLAGQLGARLVIVQETGPCGDPECEACRAADPVVWQ